MKKISFTAIILIFQLAITNAQVSSFKPRQSGETDIAELQMKDCGFSHGAAAINLLKYKEVELSVFPKITCNGTYFSKCYSQHGSRKDTCRRDYTRRYCKS